MPTARATVALVIAAALLAAGSSAAAPRADAQAPVRGSILFKGGPGGVDLRPRIYAVDTGGDRLKEVLADAYDARWSPDGRRLAFLRYTRSGAAKFGLPADLYVMRADGTGLKRVTGLVQPYGGGDAGLSWSPDGKRIAFREVAGRDEVISAIGVNGGRRVRLAKGRQPRWSPDGRLIAFTRQGSVYVMKADGTGERLVSRRAGLLSTQSWSPDGKSVAFSRCCLGGFAVADLEAGRVRTFLDGRVVLPSWSPNGRWIALVGGGTFLIRPDGKGLRRLSTLGEAPYFAAWSPDSRALAFADRCCSPDLWVVPIGGGRQLRLTEGWRYGYGNYEPEWQPSRLPTPRLAGRYVERSNPTDSVAEGVVLRTTRPIRGLVADGSRVAVRYDIGSCRRSEVWEPIVRSLVRFRSCGRPGFGGDRIAWVTGPASGGGIDTWSMATATLDVPRPASVRSVWCCTKPLSDPIGDGSLLVFSSWGPCRISLDPPCAREPKTNGELYRLDGDRASRIASGAGPLTPLSVDAGRILVDHEDGTLGLVAVDGASLRTFTFEPAVVRAALQGNDLVVQTQTAVEVIDVQTGLPLRAWPLPTEGSRLVDVHDGVAVLVTGADVHTLRLSDGRAVVIDVPGSGPVLAQLEPSGLFYAYQVEDATYPGRVSFVPFAQLPLR